MALARCFHSRLIYSLLICSGLPQLPIPSMHGVSADTSPLTSGSVQTHLEHLSRSLAGLPCLLSSVTILSTLQIRGQFSSPPVGIKKAGIPRLGFQNYGESQSPRPELTMRLLLAYFSPGWGGGVPDGYRDALPGRLWNHLTQGSLSTSIQGLL